MKENEVREGDIVEIDYIDEFTKVHRNEGKAIVLWKDSLSHQPLVTKLTEYRPTWRIYDEFSKVVGHISLDSTLECLVSPKTGHWTEEIHEEDRWTRRRFVCSHCGSWQTYGETKYCHNCGAKMEVEE